MGLETWLFIGVIAACFAYAAHKLTRGAPSNEPAKATILGFWRGNERFIDLRNLRGGTLAKNGLIEKASGKYDVTYKKGFKLKTDFDVPPQSIIAYRGGGDFPNGLIVVYPLQELMRLGNSITKHLLKEMQKIDLKLEQYQNAFTTLSEMESKETSVKQAREFSMRQVHDIEDIRRPLRAETERLRQAIEVTPATPPKEKTVESTTVKT